MSDAQDARWWLREGTERAAAIQSCAQTIWREHSADRLEMFHWANLYEPMAKTWAPGRNMRSAGRSGMTKLIKGYNVSKSVVDTYVALLTKDRPKVSALTNGATRDLQLKAKLLEKFVHGIFEAADFWDTSTQCAFDSAKFPFGCAKIFADPGADGEPPTIRLERKLPWEVLIEDFDSIYGKPRVIYDITSVDRLALQEAYPKLAGELETVSSSGYADDGAGSYDPDQHDVVVVVEAYRLPRVEGEKGFWTTCVGDLILQDVPYLHAFPPHVFLHRQKPTTGIMGQSLLRELAPIQLRINKRLWNIERAQDLIVGHWLVENGSDLNTGDINDRIGGIMRYTGTPPRYEAPVTVANDVYNQLDRDTTQAYALAGISQMSAQAVKPVGLNSEPAINAYADVQTARFKPSYELYQKFHLQCGRQVLAIARDITEKHPSFEVRAIGKASMSVIKASDALLADNEFSLELQATNAFADSIPAKIQQVQSLVGANLLAPSTGKRLMNEIPDVQAEMDFEDASYNLVSRYIEKMLDDGEWNPPMAFMQLVDEPDGSPGAIRIVQHAILTAELEGAKEKNIELLRRWVEIAEGMVSPPPAAPAAPGASGAPPPAPGAAPVPTPAVTPNYAPVQQVA